MNKKEKSEIINEILNIINKPKTIYVETCREDVTLPEYANIGDAGMDIRSTIDVNVEPGETILIPTGLKLVIPEGFELDIRPRSGLSLKTPLRVANSPATIDSGYRDEIGVIISNISTKGKKIYNLNEKNNKQGIYHIKKGDKIAQLVLIKYETIEFKSLENGEIKNIGANRGGGFGHTGI